MLLYLTLYIIVFSIIIFFEKDPYLSKDLSILKYSVPDFISNNKNLMNLIYEITDAKVEDGGGGAFYIFLKKNKSIK